MGSPDNRRMADDSYQAFTLGAGGSFFSVPTAPGQLARGTTVHHTLGYFVVFLGAGIGGSLRHAVNRAVLTLAPSFPWSTFVVNVTGCLCMGLVAGWFAFRSESGGQTVPLFLTTGVLGGYTTFSAFSLDAALLWERGQVWGAAVYVAGSVLLSIAGIFVGLALMRP